MVTQDSIWHYRPGQFKEYIRTIFYKSMFVSDALATFREVRCLPKKFRQMTVQELYHNPLLIQELYKVLRDGMASESKFKLPYNKEERQKEIIESLAENYN